MKNEKLISVDEFCTSHAIEFSFMRNLEDFGLIEIVVQKDAHYISESQLGKLEHILRLNQDLDINLEGIDAIDNLLQQVKSLQKEISRLRSRLCLYEDI